MCPASQKKAPCPTATPLQSGRLSKNLKIRDRGHIGCAVNAINSRYKTKQGGAMGTRDVYLRDRPSFATVCIKTMLTFAVISVAGYLILPLFGY